MQIVFLSCWKLRPLQSHAPNTGPSRKIIYGWLSSWTVMAKRKWRGWEEEYWGYGEAGHRGYEGGRLFFWSFLGQQKASGLCLSWQTHLACNCSDQTDNQSWKCMDKQKFTTAIGKVNRSHIRPVHKQRNCWAGALVWSVVGVSINKSS